MSDQNPYEIRVEVVRNIPVYFIKGYSPSGEKLIRCIEPSQVDDKKVTDYLWEEMLNESKNA
jgi:hypothetical protein